MLSPDPPRRGDGVSAHCKEPGHCSICLATPFRVVEVRDGVTYVDGVAVRPAQPNAAMPERLRGSQRLNAQRAAKRKR